MSGEATSVLNEHRETLPTKGDSLKHLPTARKLGPQLVAEIYFPTDVPAEDFHPINENVAGKENYTRNPEQYLSEDDITVLEKLVGGRAVFENGTGSDLKVNQLLTMNWRFVGKADERASWEHNKYLSWRRAAVVAAYLINLFRKNDDDYSEHWDIIPRLSAFDEDWRWQVCSNIFNGFHFYSLFDGEVESLPEEYPEYRTTKIFASSVGAYDDPNAVPKTCGGFGVTADYWSWDGKNQVLKPSVTVSALRQRLDVALEHLYKEYVEGTRDPDQTRRLEIRVSVQDAIYTYRYQRMLLHALYQGSWGPSSGIPKSGSNTGSVAADLLCYGDLSSKIDLLTSNPLAESRSYRSDLNKAMQLETMFLVRIDPFYRSVHMREFPGRDPETNRDFWPTEDWDSLSDTIKDYLEDRDVMWAPSKQYRTGERHNKELRSEGGYRYDSYPFRRKDLVPADSQEWQNRNISDELQSANGGYDPAGTSHLKHLRDAVHYAQVAAKRKADNLTKFEEPNFYDIYAKYWLGDQNLPDYTDPDVWETWRSPTLP